ncbi:MAG: hypothetical protein AAGA05_06930 [Pseudomonadota bacterium]
MISIRKMVLASLLAFGTAAPVLTAPPAEAGVIRKACLQSGRPAATHSACTCIQRVANRSLSRKERRIAAKFFSEPHRAQEIRQSDRRSHELFWKRYKAFGASAQQTCS